MQRLPERWQVTWHIWLRSQQPLAFMQPLIAASMAFSSDPEFYGAVGDFSWAHFTSLPPRYPQLVSSRVGARCCGPILGVPGDLRQPSGEGTDVEPPPTPSQPLRSLFRCALRFTLAARMRRWEMCPAVGRAGDTPTSPDKPVRETEHWQGRKRWDKCLPGDPRQQHTCWTTPALGARDLGRLRMLMGEHVWMCPPHSGHPWGILGPRDPHPWALAAPH